VYPAGSVPEVGVSAVVIQIRMTGSPGRVYHGRKITEGKSAKEARRCLKRRLADHI